MTGRLTLMWLGLAVAAAGGLFALKYEVQSREATLTKLNNTIIADQDAIHVLKAEWSYLNQPQKLQNRAHQHLQLEPLSAGRIHRVEDLPKRAAAYTVGVNSDASAFLLTPPQGMITLRARE